MYLYGGKDNMNKYALVFASVIIGILIGAVLVGSQRTETFVTDYDTLEISPPHEYVGYDADSIYYSLSEKHFSDVGNIYDRCTRQIFRVADLEVNRFTYTIEISDENAMIYIVKYNSTNSSEFVILDQLAEYGTVTGEINMVGRYDLGVIVFYSGLKVINISGFFDYA